MKLFPIALALLMMLLTGTVIAQTDTLPDDADARVNIDLDADEDDDNDDSWTIKFGKKRKSKKRVKTRFLMLDWGISTLANNGSLDLPLGYEAFDQQYWGSNNWKFHVIRQRVTFADEHVNLMYGLTFDWQNYEFTSDQRLDHQSPVVNLIDEGIDYTFNELSTSFITIPLMLNFETNPENKWRSFRLNAGVYGSLLLDAELDLKSSVDGEQEFDDSTFNLNKARWGVIGEIGYGALNFYVDYSLTDLFIEEENSGFVLQPINIGVKIIPF